MLPVAVAVPGSQSQPTTADDQSTPGDRFLVTNTPPPRRLRSLKTRTLFVSRTLTKFSNFTAVCTLQLDLECRTICRRTSDHGRSQPKTNGGARALGGEAQSYVESELRRRSERGAEGVGYPLPTLRVSISISITRHFYSAAYTYSDQ